MAAGFWNKFKKFFGKVKDGVKKVFTPVFDVVKPLVHTFKEVIPGGPMIDKVLTTVDPLVRQTFGPGDRRVRRTIDRMKPAIDYGTSRLSDRINFKD